MIPARIKLIVVGSGTLVGPFPLVLKFVIPKSDA